MGLLAQKRTGNESGEDRFAACKGDFDYLAKYPWTKVKAK
jgi:hypothetical protein